jgi:YVTN family beta-propeller protein
LGDVPGLRNAHGVALDQDRGLAFVTNGADDSVVVVDLESLSAVQRIGTGRNPDAILYEPLRREIYAFNHSSGSVTVIDPALRTAVATIEAPGALESGVSDGAGRVYVNSEDRNEVHVLDVRKRVKVASWALPGCKEPTGIAMDVRRRRLFSACKNGVMVVLDADSGRAVAQLPIGAGSDGAAYDGALRLVYSSNKDGTLSVIHAGDADRFEPMRAIATAPGAKTVALDPATHRLYLPVADLAPAPSGTGSAPVPGTFRVIVVAPQ